MTVCNILVSSIAPFSKPDNRCNVNEMVCLTHFTQQDITSGIELNQYMEILRKLSPN